MNNNNIDEVNKMIKKAEKELEGEVVLPFSEKAFCTLKEKIGSFICDLIIESNKVSKRHKSETSVSSHVEHASEHLIASTKKKLVRHLGTIGGILLGAATSNTISLTSSNDVSGLDVLLTIVLGAVGSFLVAIQMVKE